MARAKGETYRNRRDVDGNKLETRLRPCLRCRRAFESEGAHHRLCLGCGNRDVSPYAV